LTEKSGLKITHSPQSIIFVNGRLRPGNPPLSIGAITSRPTFV
jgi:hypothetical protein